MILTGETPQVLAENPAPMPLCPPQISRELAWDRNRVCAVKGRVANRLGHCTAFLEAPIHLRII